MCSAYLFMLFAWLLSVLGYADCKNTCHRGCLLKNFLQGQGITSSNLSEIKALMVPELIKNGKELLPVSTYHC